MRHEDAARVKIDALLTASGWDVQDYPDLDLSSPNGIAVREFPLKQGHGTADYLLYVNRRAVCVVEAKKTSQTLTGVEVQTEKYSHGLPDSLPAVHRPLPWLYESAGEVTRFTNALDPDAASREVLAFHRPETMSQEHGLSDSSIRPTFGKDRDPSCLTLLPRLQTLSLLAEEDFAITRLRSSRIWRMLCREPAARTSRDTGEPRESRFNLLCMVPHRRVIGTRTGQII
jgi:type I restriction enzyme R subunit